MLRDYAAACGEPGAPAPDNVLVIRAGRLDARQRNAAWFKALDQAGVIVQIWPVSVQEMPRWLAAQLRERGLQLTDEAERYLRERVEGNLLAAVQEMEKLRLAGLTPPIDANQMASMLEDSAHYSAFELIDAVFAGDAGLAARILAGLREEGVALFAILGALTSQLRMLESGRGMPPQRKRLASGFARRVACRAASMVAPVARPSSMTSTVRSTMSTLGRLVR